jgi:N-acylglucosamine 2-epimerase
MTATPQAARRRLGALHEHVAATPVAVGSAAGAPPRLRASAPDGLSLQEMRDVWQADLTESVMPFWSTHGADEEHGGYFTCLDRAGEVYDDRKFMWLQGRAVYTFSRMFIEFDSLHPPAPAGGSGQRRAKLDRDAARLEYRRLAKLGAEFLKKGRGNDGINDDLLFFSLSRDGQYKLHLQRKPYAAVRSRATTTNFRQATASLTS